MTLQGGLRYDYLLTSYPESKIGGPGYTAAAQPEIVYPSRSTQGIHWHDVTARWGVAYDVFGNGKTAVKLNMGKYMEAFVASNSDFDLNPLIRSTISTTRVWTDTNKDFVVELQSRRTPQQQRRVRGDERYEPREREVHPDLRPRLDHRLRQPPVQLGDWAISVQQEVMPRVSVDVGYFRNWWNNWYAVDNRATVAADYTPFSIRAPVDPRLPGGGGQVISGLYDLVPGKVGLLDELAQHADNFGEQIENWQGVDVNVSARLRNGLTIRGGTSTGRRLEDACGLKAALPEQGANANGSNTGIAGDSLVDPYCKVVEPYKTRFSGLVSYTVPKIEVQLSGTWRNNPGAALEANFIANNAYIASRAAAPRPRSLERHERHGEPDRTGDVLRPPAQQHRHAPREDHPVRPDADPGWIRHLQPHEQRRGHSLQPDVQPQHDDLAERRPAITPARYIRFNAQFDF